MLEQGFKSEVGLGDSKPGKIGHLKPRGQCEHPLRSMKVHMMSGDSQN